MSVHPSVCLSIHTAIHPSVHLSVRPSVHAYICMCVRAYVPTSVCLYVCPSVRLSTGLFVILYLYSFPVWGSSVSRFIYLTIIQRLQIFGAKVAFNTTGFYSVDPSVREYMHVCVFRVAKRVSRLDYNRLVKREWSVHVKNILVKQVSWPD